ncbi:hypothetical protein ACWENR_10520, partial [Micromonospora sp. NPDC004336]
TAGPVRPAAPPPTVPRPSSLTTRVAAVGNSVLRPVAATVSAVEPVLRTTLSTTRGVVTHVVGLVGMVVAGPPATPGHPAEPASPPWDVPSPAGAAPAGSDARADEPRQTGRGAPSLVPTAATVPASPEGPGWCPAMTGGAVADPGPPPAGLPSVPAVPQDDCAATTDGGVAAAAGPAVDPDWPTPAGFGLLPPPAIPGDRLCGVSARPG